MVVSVPAVERTDSGSPALAVAPPQPAEVVERDTDEVIREQEQRERDAARAADEHARRFAPTAHARNKDGSVLE